MDVIKWTVLIRANCPSQTYRPVTPQDDGSASHTNPQTVSIQDCIYQLVALLFSSAGKRELKSNFSICANTEPTAMFYSRSSRVHQLFVTHVVWQRDETKGKVED